MTQPSKQSRQPSAATITILFIFASLSMRVSLAQMYAPGSGEALPAEELFPVCTFCHAPEAQGSQRLDAPALAGMETWYFEQQLHNFRNRIRGMHPDDVTGYQMSIVSGMARNDATIEALAAYAEALEPGAPLETFDGETMTTTRPYIWDSPYAEFTPPEPGDPTRGKTSYNSICAACHGVDGEGNQALGSPKLYNQPEWYLARQLKYFRDGMRGTDPRDIYGIQMAAMSRTLGDDQAIADVIAYIKGQAPGAGE